MTNKAKYNLYTILGFTSISMIWFLGSELGKREVYNEPIEKKIEQTDSIAEVKKLKDEKKTVIWLGVLYIVGLAGAQLSYTSAGYLLRGKHEKERGR